MDAFIIRMAVVPSLMFLFGDANWWFPKWLDRIFPHLAVDPEDPSDEEDPAPSGGPDAPADTPADPVPV
jgi:RND superfamily putative drug exporter